MEEKNVMIICITIIIAVLIISATVLLINSNNNNLLNPSNNENNEINISNNQNNENQDNNNGNTNNNVETTDSTGISVKSVTFYSDGNPNTGETATINFGSEHSGETVNVKTLYSRDGVRQNYPSGYESHTIDSSGNIVITDYTPMPKYPSNCVIEINYNGYTTSYECDIGTYKGTQTSIPRRI